MSSKQIIAAHSSLYVIASLLFIAWVFGFILLEWGLIIHGLLAVSILIFVFKLRKDFSREQRLVKQFNPLN